MYLCSTQKAEVEFGKSSNPKSSEGRLATKRSLLIVNHEHKENSSYTLLRRIFQAIARKARPSLGLMNVVNLKSGDCVIRS